MDATYQEVNKNLYIKTFIYLLKKEKCYNKYRLNIPFNVLSNLSPRCFLSSAFIWDNTSEGHDFWRNIDNKWFNIIKVLDKKICV